MLHVMIFLAVAVNYCRGGFLSATVMRKTNGLLVPNSLIRPSSSLFLSSKKTQLRSINQGKLNQQFQKAASRENRISVLEEIKERSSAEEAELQGLKKKSSRFEEQYNPSQFSEEHLKFKDDHNAAFLALIRYCQEHSERKDPINVFFLDGPDARTATSLRDSPAMDIAINQCYVANRHQSSCDALLKWGLKNVVCLDATLALTGPFDNIDFGAYYFDGCGGYALQIVNMMEAAFAMKDDDETCRRCSPIAIGFSIVGGNRDVMDKEVTVVQSLAKLAKRMGMRVSHVLDEPERYGVCPDLRKVEGGTMTSWIILERVEADRK